MLNMDIGIVPSGWNVKLSTPIMVTIFLGLAPSHFTNFVTSHKKRTAPPPPPRGLEPQTSPKMISIHDLWILAPDLHLRSPIFLGLTKPNLHTRNARLVPTQGM